MKKLEMYNLANASHWMDQTDGYPYIESLCNHRDPVSDRPIPSAKHCYCRYMYMILFYARYLYTHQHHQGRNEARLRLR